MIGSVALHCPHGVEGLIGYYGSGAAKIVILTIVPTGIRPAHLHVSTAGKPDTVQREINARNYRLGIDGSAAATAIVLIVRSGKCLRPHGIKGQVIRRCDGGAKIVRLRTAAGRRPARQHVSDPCKASAVGKHEAVALLHRLRGDCSGAAVIIVGYGMGLRPHRVIGGVSRQRFYRSDCEGVAEIRRFGPPYEHITGFRKADCRSRRHLDLAGCIGVHDDGRQTGRSKRGLQIGGDVHGVLCVATDKFKARGGLANCQAGDVDPSSVLTRVSGLGQADDAARIARKRGSVNVTCVVSKVAGLYHITYMDNVGRCFR